MLFRSLEEELNLEAGVEICMPPDVHAPSFICEEVPEVAMPNVPGSSRTTTNQSDSPSNFVLEEDSNLETGVEICMPTDVHAPSLITNMQSQPQSRCEL